MKNIKLVIFDLDGVLVDACEWHRLALNQALKEVCNYEISLEDHYNTFNGIPTRKKLKALSEMKILPLDNHDLIYEKKQDLTIEMIKKHAKIRNEKISLINSLKEKGIKVACYTNSIRKTAELMLKKTGVYELMDYVLTNQDVTSPKPDPEGYDFLVKKFKLQKENVVIVEDSPKGKLAAYASGCNVLEVKNPEEVSLKIFKEILK